MANTEIVKLQFKRGPEAILPNLDAGEPAVTTDSKKVFVGTGINGQNIELSTKDYVNSQIASVQAGNPVDISVKADKTYVDQQLVDLATINSYITSYGYNPDGSVSTETIKDASNNTIKTTTYNYDTSGNVTSSVSTVNGRQVTTTYNYDASGNITSTTNTVI